MPANVGAAVLGDNFNIASDNYMQGAQIAMRRKQLALQEKSMQNDADAAKAKAGKDAYEKMLAEGKKTNAEIVAGVAPQMQPGLIKRMNAWVEKLSKDHLANGGKDLSQLQVENMPELTGWQQDRARYNVVDKNIENAVNERAAVAGMNKDAINKFLRTKLINEDGTLNDVSPEAINALIDDNLDQFVETDAGLEAYRKRKGGQTISVRGKVTGKDGSSRSGMHSHFMGPDMELDKDNVPVIRNEVLSNEPPKGNLSISGIKLTPEDQTEAQVYLGVHANTPLKVSKEEDYVDAMEDRAVAARVNAAAIAFKKKFEEENGEPFSTNPKVNELLKRSILQDRMTRAADSKSAFAEDVKVAPAPTTIINNNSNTPEQATRTYFQETANEIEKATGNRGGLVSGLGNQAVSRYIMQYLATSGIKDKDGDHRPNTLIVRVLPNNKMGVWKSIEKPNIKDGKPVMKDGKPHILAGSTGEPIAIIDGEEMDLALNKGNVSTSKGGQGQYKGVTGGKKYTEVDIRAAAKASGMSVEDYKKAAGL